MFDVVNDLIQLNPFFHLSFVDNAKRRVGAIDNLSLSLTSHALSSSDRFPLVTLPDFERRVTGVLDQAQIISLTYMPLVTNETRYMWEVSSFGGVDLLPLFCSSFS